MTKYADNLVMKPILDATQIASHTFVRTTDARSALARGLEEYLLTLSIQAWEGGREVRLKNVQVCWAQPEDPAEKPSAVILALDEAKYDSSQMSPSLVLVNDETTRYLRKVAELVQQFQVCVFTTDPVERCALTAMIEDGLNPAEYMTGLRLELPYYFNTRATYEPLSLMYADDTADAQRRYRRSIITISGHISQLVPVGKIPFMNARTVTEIEE